MNAFSPSYANFQKLEERPKLPVIGNQRKWDVAKIVFRSISLAAGLSILAALIGVFVMRINLRPMKLSFPVTIVICAWDIAEFITICARRSKSRGIKPAAHVGVELVIWLFSFLTMGVQTWAISMPRRHRIAEHEHIARHWIKIDQAHIGLLFFEGLIHFILFTRACVEVDRKKKDRRVQQLVLAVQQQQAAVAPPPGYVTQHNTGYTMQEGIPLSPMAPPQSTAPSTPIDRDFAARSYYSDVQSLDSPQQPKPVEIMTTTPSTAFVAELPADTVYYEMPGSRTSGLSTAAAAAWGAGAAGAKRDPSLGAGGGAAEKEQQKVLSGAFVR
ncbi:hypothetical protein F5B20DRAFT_97125 [Whalleya microplaca]|nr:hypothetical protein F5B20DRAFT_97125 [Whalleya microplaca]